MPPPSKLPRLLSLLPNSGRLSLVAPLSWVQPKPTTDSSSSSSVPSSSSSSSSTASPKISRAYLVTRSKLKFIPSTILHAQSTLSKRLEIPRSKRSVKLTSAEGDYGIGTGAITSRGVGISSQDDSHSHTGGGDGEGIIGSEIGERIKVITEGKLEVHGKAWGLQLRNGRRVKPSSPVAPPIQELRGALKHPWVEVNEDDLTEEMKSAVKEWKHILEQAETERKQAIVDRANKFEMLRQQRGEERKARIASVAA